MLFLGIVTDCRDHDSKPEYHLTSEDIACIGSTAVAYPLLLEHDDKRECGRVWLVASSRYLYAGGFISDSCLKRLETVLAIYYNKSERKNVTLPLLIQKCYPNLSLANKRDRQSVSDKDFVREVSLVGLGGRCNTPVVYGWTIKEIAARISNNDVPRRMWEILERANDEQTKYGGKAIDLEFITSDLLQYCYFSERQTRLQNEYKNSKFDDSFLRASANTYTNNNHHQVEKAKQVHRDQSPTTSAISFMTMASGGGEKATDDIDVLARRVSHYLQRSHDEKEQNNRELEKRVKKIINAKYGSSKKLHGSSRKRQSASDDDDDDDLTNNHRRRHRHHHRDNDSDDDDDADYYYHQRKKRKASGGGTSSSSNRSTKTLAALLEHIKKSDTPTAADSNSSSDQQPPLVAPAKAQNTWFEEYHNVVNHNADIKALKECLRELVDVVKGLPTAAAVTPQKQSSSSEGSSDQTNNKNNDLLCPAADNDPAAKKVVGDTSTAATTTTNNNATTTATTKAASDTIVKAAAQRDIIAELSHGLSDPVI